MWGRHETSDAAVNSRLGSSERSVGWVALVFGVRSARACSRVLLEERIEKALHHRPSVRVTNLGRAKSIHLVTGQA